MNIFKNASILSSICSDHFPISCILESSFQIQLGKNFWKFNSSLTNDEMYVTQMKQHRNEVFSIEITTVDGMLHRGLFHLVFESLKVGFLDKNQNMYEHIFKHLNLVSLEKQ